jgi:PAS domain S-box-containing protein
VLVHRGRLRLATVVLLASLWGGATVGVAFGGRVDGPAISVYLLAILGAGLLHGGRAAMVTAAASAIAALALVLLEERGLLPRLILHTPRSAVAVEVTLFVASAGLLWDALRRIEAARERVVRSEERTRSLVEQAADGIVVTDRDGRVLETNARLLEMTGYARDETLGLGIESLLAGSELEDARRLLADLAPGEVAVRDRAIRRKDGSTLETESSITRLSDGRFQAILRDVSARRAFERRFDHLRVAFEEAGEGIILLDRHERVVFANRAFREAFGRSGHSEPGQPATALPVDPAASDLEEVRATLRRGETWVGRHVRTAPDGRRTVHFAVYAPARDRSGELVGFVGVLRDMTRETELEESLRQSQKLEAVGQLAGGLAHDFNNLLTVILGAGEALRAGRPSPEVDEILEAGRRAADLTTQLLAFSRQQVVRTERLDLNALIADAAPVLDRLVRENVRLVLERGDGPCWVAADPNQLHQVLVNLAANARDAMPDGGRFVLRTGTRELAGEETRTLRLSPGPYVVLTVEDSGVGMADEVVERIFEPFFTTKGPGRGTGLGLSSVHGIVQQAGGAIEVESRPGKGTRFRIFLPRVAAQTRSESPSEHARPATRRARVLIVEDEPAVRRIVRRALEAAGHEVVEAADGEQALAGDLSRGVELLVTDVVLPGRDGASVAAELRARHPGLRVLYTSGHVPEEFGDAIADGEGREFLQKPFRPGQLVAAAARLLDAPED